VQNRMMGATHNFIGLTFFKAGTFNGTEYTSEDLSKIAENFKILKEQVKPPLTVKKDAGGGPTLKLGHGNQQFLKDAGIPAAGWVSDVRHVDDTLVADIMNIPHRVYDLLEKKAFSRPSAEIYRDYVDEDGKKYGPTLAAIALLGGEPPAIKTLPDIEALYKNVEVKHAVNFERNMEGVEDVICFESSSIDIPTSSQEPSKEEVTTAPEVQEDVKGDVIVEDPKPKGGNDTMNEPEVQIAGLQTQIDALKAELETSKEELETSKGELEMVQGEVEEAKTEAEEAEARASESGEEINRRKETDRLQELTTYVSTLKEEGKVLPVQEASLVTLLSTMEYNTDDVDALITFSDNGGEVETLTQLDLMKKMLSVTPNLVKFDELSKKQDGDQGQRGELLYREQFTNKEISGDADMDIEDVDLALLAEKIAKEEEISYLEALSQAERQLNTG